MEAIQQDVERLCGARYARDVVLGGHYKRWGANPGSIKIHSERIRIKIQRVQDTATKKARPLLIILTNPITILIQFDGFVQQSRSVIAEQKPVTAGNDRGSIKRKIVATLC